MKNLRNLSYSLGLTLAVMTIVVTVYFLSKESSSWQRISILLGAKIWDGGFIQLLTYLAFLLAWFEIKEKKENFSRERKAFKLGIIPTQEKHVFLPQDVNNLKFKLQELERKERYILGDVVKRACSKFRATGSISELIDIVSIQIEVFQEKAESDQSLIRYLTWVIPSIGFVGTVIGISRALGVASTGSLEIITSLLGLAFDTTLVALVLSIVIMYYFHQLQEESDKFHSDLKDFVVDNLINKIELT